MGAERFIEILEERIVDKRSVLNYYDYKGRRCYLQHTDDPTKGADGAAVGVKRYGTTAERPSGSDIYTGFQYFDTTLGLPVIYDGTSWVVLPKYEVVSELPASPDSNTLYLIAETS